MKFIRSWNFAKLIRYFIVLFSIVVRKTWQQNANFSVISRLSHGSYNCKERGTVMWNNWKIGVSLMLGKLTSSYVYLDLQQKIVEWNIFIFCSANFFPVLVHFKLFLSHSVHFFFRKANYYMGTRSWNFYGTHFMRKNFYLRKTSSVFCF